MGPGAAPAIGVRVSEPASAPPGWGPGRGGVKSDEQRGSGTPRSADRKGWGEPGSGTRSGSPEGGDRPATAGRGIPGSWSLARADPPRDGSRCGAGTHRGGGGSGARAWHGLRSRGSIPLTAGIDSGTSLILRSSSRAGSSVSSAPAAGRAALMGLGCSGGRPGAPRTARRGGAGPGRSGSGRGSGRSRDQTGRLGAGGRPLKRARHLPPPAPASPPLSLRAPPRSPAPPRRPRPPACSPGRLCITAPGGQSAPRAARRQRCHSFLQSPGGGAGPRGGGAGRGEERGLDGRQPSIKGLVGREHRRGPGERRRSYRGGGGPKTLSATVKKVATNEDPHLCSSPGSESLIHSASFVSSSCLLSLHHFAGQLPYVRDSGANKKPFPCLSCEELNMVLLRFLRTTNKTRMSSTGTSSCCLPIFFFFFNPSSFQIKQKYT